MDDDLRWEGHIEVRVDERPLGEFMCTVHVPPGQQEVPDKDLLPLLSKLLPGCVVQVGTLYIFLHSCGDMVEGWGS